jgi:hypothetical protein
MGGLAKRHVRQIRFRVAVDTVVAVKCLFLIRLELLGPTLLGMKACWSPWDGRQARAARARPILGCGA